MPVLEPISEHITRLKAAQRQIKESIHMLTDMERDQKERQARGDTVATIRTALNLRYADVESQVDLVKTLVDDVTWKWAQEWKVGINDGTDESEIAGFIVVIASGAITTINSNAAPVSTGAFSDATHGLTTSDTVELLNASDRTTRGIFALSSVVGSVITLGPLPGSAPTTIDTKLIIRIKLDDTIA